MDSQGQQRRLSEVVKKDAAASHFKKVEEEEELKLGEGLGQIVEAARFTCSCHSNGSRVNV